MFVQSQMLVTDELKHRKRTVGLMFFDFVEALARLAEFISPPSMELLAKKVYTLQAKLSRASTVLGHLMMMPACKFPSFSLPC